jgi:hypothetical protein
MPVFWQIVFAPGMLGYLLLGGVHGSASVSSLSLAWSVTNGLFWAGVMQFCLNVARSAKRPPG